MHHQCIQLRLSSNNVYRWEFTRSAETFPVGTAGNLVVDSTRLALSGAIGGLGIAYVLRSLAAEALASSDLVQVLEAWTPPYPGLALYYLRHRHMSAAMQALVEFLRDKGSRARLTD